MADLKEVFMLFDKDHDGVLSFSELGTAMKTLGQRPSGKISKECTILFAMCTIINLFKIALLDTI